MKYDAFISYRHAPLDMEVAKKLHTGLETYKIPKSVQNKTGKKKMGRVFRDQEELPIGSDLDNNITVALEGSKYLIVICSPRTPESYWVCKEIETFIQMHDRNHVLAVLIEGEPEESFPAQLLTDEEGNPVEPLAADVRGANKKERNTKYKTELLRLAAPIIGCTYDELRQRHRERVIRKTVTLASAVAGVVAVSGISFGIYNANVATKMKQLADEKTQMADELAVQYKGKQENQSRFYAQEALSLFESGNREDAVLVAMEGLPSENDDRPYVPEAEYALSKALYTYDDGKTMSFERNLQHKLPVNDMRRTDHYTKLVTVDSGRRVYVWNVEDWSLLTVVEPTVDDRNYFEDIRCADADASGVYVATYNRFSKYDYEGNLIYSNDYDGTIEEAQVCDDENKAVITFNNEIVILDSATGEKLESISGSTGETYKSEGKYYADKRLYIVADSHDDGTKASFIFINLENNTSKEIMLSESDILKSTMTDSGNLAILCCNHDLLENGLTHMTLELLDIEGNRIWTEDIDAHISSILSFNSAMSCHDYEDGDKIRKDIVFAVESKAYTVDEETGEIRTVMDLPGETAMMALSVGSSFGRIGYKYGGIDFIDFASGKIYSEHKIDTNDSIREAVLYDGAIVFSSYKTSDVHVLTWHDAPDAEDFLKNDRKMVVSGITADSEYFALTSSDFDDDMLAFYDKDGKEVCSFDKFDYIEDLVFVGHKAYFHDNGIIYIVDLDENKMDQINLEDYGFDRISLEMSISYDGKIATIWTSSDCIVINLQEKKAISLLKADGQIGYAITASDGKRIYITEAGDSLYAFDTQTKENLYFKDDNLRTVSDSYFNKFIALSADEKYLAVCCMDGITRVVDTESFETVSEIDMNSYSNKYIGFTEDGEHIILQNDDYMVHICDIKTSEVISSMQSFSPVTNIVFDKDSNLMAVLSQGGEMLLYETEGFGCVAESDGVIAYLSGDNSILISNDGTDIKRSHYKNYKELIELARRQFGDVKLSQEKKVKYNIN